MPGINLIVPHRPEKGLRFVRPFLHSLIFEFKETGGEVNIFELG